MSTERNKFQRIESIFKELSAMRDDDPDSIESRLIELTRDDTDLAEEVRAGRFREDLYARLNRCVVRMPPLLERREDGAADQPQRDVPAGVRVESGAPLRYRQR